MNIIELSIPELQENLERLHRYLNDKYFGGALCDARVMIGRDGSRPEGYVIRYPLRDVIRVQRVKLPNPKSVERYQFKWMLSSMLHSMIDQYKAEGGQDAPAEVAERCGLICYGTKTEWMNPLRFSFIEQEFQFHRGCVSG